MSGLEELLERRGVYEFEWRKRHAVTLLPTQQTAADLIASLEIGGPLSQQDLATLCGVSRARISQIELRALEKIRRAIQSFAKAAGVSPAEWLEV
jgi:DNA-directed RNA polymerase sigma subunit (sigma70/sigma32)